MKLPHCMIHTVNGIINSVSFHLTGVKASSVTSNIRISLSYRPSYDHLELPLCIQQNREDKTVKFTGLAGQFLLPTTRKQQFLIQSSISRNSVVVQSGMRKVSKEAYHFLSPHSLSLSLSLYIYIYICVSVW